MTSTRVEVEYLISGLDRELRDGLRRLTSADAADDHAVLYRRWFDQYVADLRSELDSPTPDIHAIAVAAIQASWLARIWPVLHASRAQWRGPDRLKQTNAEKQTAANTRRDRCVAIAATLTRPTPAAIRTKYHLRYPKEALPAVRTIRRYLASPQR